MNLKNKIRTAWAMFSPRPIILYHKPTTRCDCRCQFCDSWKHQSQEDDVLPTGKIINLLDRAAKAGMTTYTLWGGESLLVDDLEVWLEHAYKLGMNTVICTSALKLAERAREIGPWTDRLLVSLEAVGARHDKLRGVPGSFKKIVEGLNEFCTYSDGSVTLWSNINNANKNHVTEIALFAKKEHIDVEFFPMAEYPDYNEELLLDPIEQNEVFSRVIELKRKGYPIHNTWYALELMRTKRPFRCNIPRLSVQVHPDGMIYACEPRIIPNLAPYGNIDDTDLTRLPATDHFQRTAEKLQSCNRCLLPCVAHMADSLPRQLLRRRT